MRFLYKGVCAYSPYCSLYIPKVTNKKNLFSDQELLQTAITSFILVALVFDFTVFL